MFSYFEVLMMDNCRQLLSKWVHVFATVVLLACSLSKYEIETNFVIVWNKSPYNVRFLIFERFIRKLLRGDLSGDNLKRAQ